MTPRTLNARSWPALAVTIITLLGAAAVGSDANGDGFVQAPAADRVDGSAHSLPAEAWAAIEEAIERDRYGVVEATGGMEGIVSAANPAQGYSTHFTDDGIRLRPAGSGPEIVMQLAGYGYDSV